MSAYAELERIPCQFVLKLREKTIILSFTDLILILLQFVLTNIFVMQFCSGCTSNTMFWQNEIVFSYLEVWSNLLNSNLLHQFLTLFCLLFLLRKLARHVMSRAVCLIVIPSILYLLQFYILFAVARKTGPHDDMMSSAFQASLEVLRKCRSFDCVWCNISLLNANVTSLLEFCFS